MTTACNFRCSYCYEDYKNSCQLNEKSLKEILDFVFRSGKGEDIFRFFRWGAILRNIYYFDILLLVYYNKFSFLYYLLILAYADMVCMNSWQQVSVYK